MQIKTSSLPAASTSHISPTPVSPTPGQPEAKSPPVAPAAVLSLSSAAQQHLQKIGDTDHDGDSH